MRSSIKYNQFTAYRRGDTELYLKSGGVWQAQKKKKAGILGHLRNGVYTQYSRDDNGPDFSWPYNVHKRTYTEFLHSKNPFQKI